MIATMLRFQLVVLFLLDGAGVTFAFFDRIQCLQMHNAHSAFQSQPGTVPQSLRSCIFSLDRHRRNAIRLSTSGKATALSAAQRFKNFEEVLDTYREEPVMIYFSTSRCGPCRLMKKELHEARKMMGEKMKMFSLDTEKWPEVGSRFHVQKLPCLVVFREGEIKLKLEGVNKAAEVVERVLSSL